MSLQVIRGKMIKEEGKKPVVIEHKKYLEQLDQLEPGTYEFVIQPAESKLKRLKKHYFAMESELGKHLGYKKSELHEVLKEHIGHNADHEYVSIKDITTESDVWERVEELHQFAAKYFEFTFKPYNPDEYI